MGAAWCPFYPHRAAPNNRTVRHERLDRYVIETIDEAQDHATQWLWSYNNRRLCCTNQPEVEFPLPLGGVIPRAEFAVFQGP